MLRRVINLAKKCPAMYPRDSHSRLTRRTAMTRLFLIMSLVCVFSRATLASMLSVGPLGIDAIGLRGPFNELLTGNGIKIGQVEDLRPADPDVDDLFANPTLNPAQVWRQQQTPSPDDDFVG